MKNFKLAIASIFLLAGISYAQEGFKKVRINDFTGGMNSHSLSSILPLNQGASMVNVEISRPGMIFKRKGQDLFNQDTGDTPFYGIGRFDPDATTSYLVAASGTQIIRSTSSAEQWTVANPSNALTPAQNTDFIQANDLLFALNGFDNTSWYNGSAWTPGLTYPTSPPVATTGAWLRNYLFLAGGTSERDWVYISNNLEPRTFSASDIIKINTGDGQRIQHIEPFKQNELIIYKERSVFVLDITGSPPASCTTDCWTVQPISTTIGTVAPRSVVSLGNDHWFLSSNPIAIRSLARSQFDKILLNYISEPIQDIFDGTGELTINRTYINRSAAVLFDNKYFLAVPTGTSLVNNTVLVFNFLTNGWYIIQGWYPSDWVVFDERLFYTDANDGRVVECFAANYGDWSIGPSDLTSESIPTEPIRFYYQSKAIDFDEPENFKQADAIEVEFEPTGNYNANVYINLDNDGWTSIGTVNLAGNSLTLPFDLPSPLSSAGLARKTFQTQQYGEFKKMQVMVEQTNVDEKVNLQRITIFGRLKPWRRE